MPRVLYQSSHTTVWAIDGEDGDKYVGKNSRDFMQGCAERYMLSQVQRVPGVLLPVSKFWLPKGNTPLLFPRGVPLTKWLSTMSEIDGVSVEDALKCVAESLVETLHQVHQCDVVHCDVKPDNIVVLSNAANALFYLIDFGQAVKRGVEKENCSPGTVKHWRGTRRFVSDGALRLEAPRPQHDFESLLISLHTLAFPKKRRMWDKEVGVRPLPCELGLKSAWYRHVVAAVNECE